ncbi:hypothetical protein B0F90DRAFT_1814573 [Multifurca ochricompacta]|uniref:Peptidase S9 prolyl oligopeptidase catalytic domain-containing protein n=1 Tax=Multifurca ochricompacta TaxID=376703 RepID=A0AAD4MBU0_9AGAM|nr:hypothetical protein B0F90DRAFT_1814573 [Multifurca ochricompacta]
MHGVDDWTIHIAQTWDILGPFPIHAREQHILSPSFPLDLNAPIDLDASYPSSLADGGYVYWARVSSPPGSDLLVSFPHIRWASLRATEGWAALQHHSVLRTTLTLLPPRTHFRLPPTVPNLLIELKRGSFFTLLPANVESEQGQDIGPQWYSGNIYDIDQAPPHLVRLPTKPSPVSPTAYHLYISGDYEIRLFADPRNAGSEVPTLSISVNVRLELPAIHLRRETFHDAVPDFVEGFAFGDALGIGLRCLSPSWWTVTALSPSPELCESGIVLSLLSHARFAPGQARVVPIRISQSKPFDGDTLSFSLHATSDESSLTLPIQVPVLRLAHWSRTGTMAITASYFSTDTAPTGFIVLPPEHPNNPCKVPSPPILALHGAGVDIFKQHFWVEAIPRQKRSWGLDWHGPSADDAWGTVSALATILEASSRWQAWTIKPERVVIIGHSNGGQGTWYNAARHPDRVVHVAVIPAAGYIKAQAYVPLTQSRSAHFIDPFLRAVLECSFTPDDNDLFLSNLVDTPALVIHGGADENVPTWHSRAAVSVLKTWAADAVVSYREEQGQNHWYPSVFKNAQVSAFLDSVLNEERRPPRRSTTFTLTTAVPADTGSLHGWRILSLLATGRLARLTVKVTDGIVLVSTSNVRCFSIDASRLEARQLDIDGYAVAVPDLSIPRLYFQNDTSGWRIPTAAESPWVTQRSMSPYTILRSSGPLRIVISGSLGSEMSVAQRLASDLGVYYKLDADIVLETEVLKSQDRPHRGNIVVVGSPSGRYVRQCLSKGRTAFTIAERESGPPVLQLRGETLTGLSQGIVFTHPHEDSPTSTMLFMIAHDQSGLERAARLFPTRTGLALADWMVIGKRADKEGASGIQRAGLWGGSWEYNSGMSWQH